MSNAFVKRYAPSADREKQIKKKVSEIKKLRLKSLDDIKAIVENDVFLYYSSFEFLLEQDDRKKTGAFYTPEWVVLMMVNYALEKWLQSNHDLWSIKILDPACGSGNYPHIIIDVLAEKMSQKYGDKTREDIVEHIIQNCLYAFDVNERAIEVARSRIESLYHVKPVNVVVKDALINGSPMKFDIIIGNPPYGDILTKEQKRVLKDKHNNIALNFIDWSLEHIKETGEVLFIVPHSFTRARGYEDWRKRIKSERSLHTVMDMGNPFYDITLEEVVFGFNLQKNEHVHSFSFKDQSYEKIIPVNQFYESRYGHKMVIYWDEWYVLMNLHAHSYPFSGHRGLDVSKKNLDEEGGEGKCWFVLGKNITKEGLKSIPGYDRYIDMNHPLIRERLVIQNEVVAITQFGINLKASVLNADCYPSGGVVVVSAKNLMNHEVVEYLNKPEINQYLKRYVFNNADLTVHMDGVYLSEIPYVKLNSIIQRKNGKKEK